MLFADARMSILILSDGDHLAWFDRKMVVVLGGSVYMWDSVNKRIDTVYSTERPARYRGIR